MATMVEDDFIIDIIVYRLVGVADLFLVATAGAVVVLGHDTELLYPFPFRSTFFRR